MKEDWIATSHFVSGEKRSHRNPNGTEASETVTTQF